MKKVNYIQVQVKPSHKFVGVEKPIVRIINICNRIRNYDYEFQNLNTEIKRAEKVADDIHLLYNELISLIPNVNIAEYDILAATLHLLETTMFLRVLGDKLSYKKFDDTNLERAIKNISYKFNITQKWHDYEQKALKEQHDKEVAKLNKMGLRIIQRKYNDWHFNNIFDVGRWKWKKREDYERVRLPWDENYEQYLKDGY